MDVDETPISSANAPRRRSWLPWLIAAAAVVISAVVVVGVVAASDDDDTSLGTQQLASIQHACGQWRDGYTGPSAPSSAWCDDMVGWMTSQVRGGHMMGSTMWSDPDQMRATCEAWLSSSQGARGASPDASAWCGEMVSWMTQHMGDWDEWDRGWMMNRSMMGG